MDELLQNDLNIPVSKDEADEAELIKKIRTGLAIIFAAIAGVWSYSANRFRYDEILIFIGVGALVGYCLGMVYHSTLKYLKQKEDASK